MNKNNFLTGHIAPALIKFTLPLMLSLVLQALYGAEDLMIVGMFGSTSSVAAVATGSHLMQTLTVIITAYNGISGIFRGIGNSKSPLLFVFIACICNIILDIIFNYYWYC